MKRHLGVTIGLLSLVATTASAGLFDLPNVDILDDIGVQIPGLDRAFREEPPITTSLADAYYGVEFLDSYQPRWITSMHTLQRAANGDFKLERPGVFEVTVESFCLHAGTYGPRGRGEGYLLAPLKGPCAGVIEAILQGSMAHPEVPQSTVQSLIWGVLARTRIDDMSDELQQAARLFLTPEQIRDLNGRALGEIPAALFERAFGRLPSPLRQVWEAESRLRSLLVSGVIDYAQLEQVAVLTGEPPQPEGPLTPAGRWSYHPDGYFIRFFPNGYSEMCIQVSVPQSLLVERDTDGRITRVADGAGNRIEMAYDDTIAPLQIGKSMRGFAFSQVRFIRRLVVPPELTLDWEATWNGQGMTLVGVPTSGKVKTAEARYANAATLHQAALAHASELAQLAMAVRYGKPKRGTPAKLAGDPDKVMGLAELTDGLELLVEEAPSEQPWAKDHLELIYRAWQGAFVEYLETQARSNTGQLEDTHLASFGGLSSLGAIAPAAADAPPQLGPATVVAQPGNPSCQRLVPGKPKPDNDDCKKVRRERDSVQAVIEALNRIDPTMYSDLQAYQEAVMIAATQIMRERGLIDGNGTAYSPMAVSCIDPFPIVPGGPQDDPAYAADWEAYNRAANWQEFVNSYVKPRHFAGLPDIIFEAALAHEMHHQNTLRNLPAGTQPCDWLSDPRNYKEEDLEAYKLQLQKLEAWLEENC